MKFLVSVPLSTKLEGTAVVATGSGLDWKASQILVTSLLEDAKKSVRFENVELKVLSVGQATPKDKLVFGSEKATRLWVDTKPCASSRFTSGLATVVQEIRAETKVVLGYIVVFPDGRVLKVAAHDLYSFCENAKSQGRNAIQNMQYVGSNGSTAAHLKNYEGRTIPVYIQHRKAVNAEKATAVVPETGKAPEIVKNVASSSFTPEQLAVIGRGKKEGVDYISYAKPAYDYKHMDAIRNVLLNKKDASLLLVPELPEPLVNLYGYDLANGADIRPYYNVDYTLKQAIQVKLGVIRGLDVSKYASITTDGDEMEQLRVRMDADMWCQQLN